MQTTLLIDYNDILHYTTISGNIDIFKINPHIHNAEILYLEPILGSDLYNKLLQLVTGATIAEPYNTLLIDYVTPSVVFHTMELFIPLNAFQIADGGVSQYTPSNANFSSIDEIDKISNKYRIIGGKYDMKLSEYLIKNSALFPEYTGNTGLIGKNETTYRSGGIYTGIKNTTYKIRI